MPHVAARTPAGIGILVVGFRATDPSNPFSIRSLTSITRHSLRLRCRAGKELPGYGVQAFSKARRCFRLTVAHPEGVGRRALTSFSQRRFCPPECEPPCPGAPG